MIFTSLASSSHGNCYVVSDGSTAILLECGISFRRIKKGLGFDLSAIRACLVSHEHRDHSKSVMELIKSGVEVFASEGTADALGCDLISPVGDRVQFQVGSLDIVPFATFHDALEPLGFLIHSRADGERLAFATDTVNLSSIAGGNNSVNSPGNPDKSPGNPQSKVEESKGKESRVLGGAPAAPAPAPTPPKRKDFVPPTVDEVAEYVSSYGGRVVAQDWVNYYAARGWMMGKTPMTDWKSAVRASETWGQWQKAGSRNDIKTPSDYEGEESFV